jgi:hypothetical protein
VGSDGRFRFTGLKDGKYSISIWHSENMAGWTIRTQHGIPAGKTSLRLELVRARRLTGRVVDPGGKPVRARVWLRAEGAQGGAKIHNTDAAGKFDVQVPPGFRGTFHARRATDRPSPSAKVEGVVAGQTELVIRLLR